MKNNKLTAILLLLTLCLSGSVLAHCQIPCGIYGDQMRFEMMREHITTIEKSMNQITELSADPGKNMNQLVRWVNNKDDHADQFTEIVTEYFLAQRIKPDAANYAKELEVLHGMIVTSMKCKQTTDLNNVKTMKTLVDEFEKLYMPKASHDHDHDHSHEG